MAEAASPFFISRKSQGKAEDLTLLHNSPPLSATANPSHFLLKIARQTTFSSPQDRFSPPHRLPIFPPRLLSSPASVDSLLTSPVSKSTPLLQQKLYSTPSPPRSQPQEAPFSTPTSLQPQTLFLLSAAASTQALPSPHSKAPHLLYSSFPLLTAKYHSYSSQPQEASDRLPPSPSFQDRISNHPPHSNLPTLLKFPLSLC